MFEEAEAKKLWFYCSYQGLWFSPSELKQAQNEGRFLWGAVNWQLRDPNEKLAEMQLQQQSLSKEIERFKGRI
ncbi:hypothetical protein A616_16890 [Brevibacillus brevis X23]|nr:hypothetical protein A616_16890 [Brevibacillus brevis X23]